MSWIVVSHCSSIVSILVQASAGEAVSDRKTTKAQRMNAAASERAPSRDVQGKEEKELPTAYTLTTAAATAAAEPLPPTEQTLHMREGI